MNHHLSLRDLPATWCLVSIRFVTAFAAAKDHSWIPDDDTSSSHCNGLHLISPASISMTLPRYLRQAVKPRPRYKSPERHHSIAVKKVLTKDKPPDRRAPVRKARTKDTVEDKPTKDQDLIYVPPQDRLTSRVETPPSEVLTLVHDFLQYDADKAMSGLSCKAFYFMWHSYMAPGACSISGTSREKSHLRCRLAQWLDESQRYCIACKLFRPTFRQYWNDKLREMDETRFRADARRVAKGAIARGPRGWYETSQERNRLEAWLLDDKQQRDRVCPGHDDWV